MVAGFYRKELKGHIEKGRLKTKDFQSHLQTSSASLEVTNQRKLQELLSMKDRDLKVMRRKNPKSVEEDVFGICYAASMGEMERLEVLLSRDKVSELRGGAERSQRESERD